MPGIPPLAELGRRIMICGPSSTGKSTLAVALGRRLAVPAIHLDALRHRAHTAWQPRPDAEFVALHEHAVAGDGWVMDGNYSLVLAPRLARATGIVLTADTRIHSLVRYVRRTLFDRRRAGALDGAPARLSWDMVHWILLRAPARHRAFVTRLRASGLPLVELHGMRQVNALYAAWGLERA